MNKEDYIKEAEELIIRMDSIRDGDAKVKTPHWLKLTKKLQYYFDWHTHGWEKGAGWYWNTERVTIGEEVL
jgi:hypothetical protein